MPLFAPKLPVPDDIRLWTNNAFLRLNTMLGEQTMLQAQVILADDRFFPDPFDASLPAAQRMADRIGGYMGLPPDCFLVNLFDGDEIPWQEVLPEWRVRSKGAAGLYFHEKEGERFRIGVKGSLLKEPDALAATIAHELAHVLLLGGGLLPREDPDMEPLTDLTTVFLGLGVLTANCAFQFKQWSEGNQQGWSWRRQGYLPEHVWAYALARFAQLRNEQQPPWANALQGNVKGYFKQSQRWLQANS